MDVPGRRAPALWRHRDFMLLWGGQAVSEMGSAVTLLALPLTAVVVLHASTLQVGVLTALATAAFLVIALPAGAVVDRLPKRRLMLVCDAARMLIIGSVPLAAALGALTRTAGQGHAGAADGHPPPVTGPPGPATRRPASPAMTARCHRRTPRPPAMRQNG